MALYTTKASSLLFAYPELFLPRHRRDSIHWKEKLEEHSAYTGRLQGQAAS